MLGFDFVDCEKFDFEMWWFNVISWRSRDEWASEKRHRYDEFQGILIRTRLFGRPGPGEGLGYAKPRQYLGAASVECGFDGEDLENACAKIIAGDDVCRDYGYYQASLEQNVSLAHSSRLLTRS